MKDGQPSRTAKTLMWTLLLIESNHYNLPHSQALTTAQEYRNWTNMSSKVDPCKTRITILNTRKLNSYAPKKKNYPALSDQKTKSRTPQCKKRKLTFHLFKV